MVRRRLSGRLPMFPGLETAAFEPANWALAAKAISRNFPGSFPAIHNIDLCEARLNFAVEADIDPHFLSSYESHYFSVNPWVPEWSSTPSGKVLVASRNSPASNFASTEFYNDWLLLQDRDASGRSWPEHTAHRHPLSDFDGSGL